MACEGLHDEAWAVGLYVSIIANTIDQYEDTGVSPAHGYERDRDQDPICPYDSTRCGVPYGFAESNSVVWCGVM